MNKITMIKRLRDLTTENCGKIVGLREAKDYVEEVESDVLDDLVHSLLSRHGQSEATVISVLESALTEVKNREWERLRAQRDALIAKLDELEDQLEEINRQLDPMGW